MDVLLESPYGARTEPRIREHFDRLVDRISGYEVKALAEGDGFTEKKYEAASIDQLLAETTTFGPPPAPPELTETVQSDLETIIHDIPIPLNERVLAYIELFQGRLHDFIEEGMTRGGKYLPMIQSVFRAEGLPLDLAYVPLIESAFKPNALSRAKAKGVWQFMAGTATENGLRQDWYHRRAFGSRESHAWRRRSICARSRRCSTATGTSRWPPTTAGRGGCSARSSGRAASTTSGSWPPRRTCCRARRANTSR